MKRKILLPFILAIFAFPLAAQPIPSKMNKFHHNKHNFQRYHEKDLDLRFLNLSNEQTTKINAIADEYKKKIDLVMLELERNKLDFDEVMITENYDFEKLKGLIEGRKKLETDVLISFLERDLKIKDLLTEEQWKIFKKKFPKNINFCENRNSKNKNKHPENCKWEKRREKKD
jgi:Spy/CpxP family protein refolding chaperone